MSDIESAAPAKKAPTPFQKRVRREARQRAAAEGLDWKVLSKEDRKLIRTEVRQELRAKRTAGKAARDDQ